jgi:hypothetical protein
MTIVGGSVSTDTLLIVLRHNVIRCGQGNSNVLGEKGRPVARRLTGAGC